MMMSHVKWGKLKKTRRERERKSERWARHLKQKQRAKTPKRADWNRIMQNDRNWYQDETLNNSNKRRKLSKLQKKIIESLRLCSILLYFKKSHQAIAVETVGFTICHRVTVISMRWSIVAGRTRIANATMKEVDWPALPITWKLSSFNVSTHHKVTHHWTITTVFNIHFF